MATIRTQLEQREFDEAQYKHYFRRHQAEYIRTKLRSILFFYQGKTVAQIASTLAISEQSARKYIAIYLTGGFEILCKKVVRPQSSLLNQDQMIDFKNVLLTKSPSEVGLEGNIWTGKLLCQYLEKTYQVSYKSGIYDLLERLNLSHQKAHADYGNAEVSDQIDFIKDLKDNILQADEKTAIVQFDEFSISSRPSTYYGWAEKNTRPRVVTNEKKEREQTDY